MKKCVPGTKLKILPGTQIRTGMILLDSNQNIQILGGKVEELIEAWEVEQRFADQGQVQRHQEGGQGQVQQAPKFKQFNPTFRSNRPTNEQREAVEKLRKFQQQQQQQQSQNEASSSGTALNREFAQQVVQSEEQTVGVAQNANIVKEKLRGKLGSDSQSSSQIPGNQYGRGRGERGRGRDRGRGRGRRGDEDGGGGGALTLEEYEARRKGKQVQSSSQDNSSQQQSVGETEDLAQHLAQNLFLFGSSQQQQDDGGNRGGRRGRGRRGGRRGRGRR
eukprot:TRINITY_DN33892_c0_g1_i2.p1 TRINITY_DN33892_c0_g1~~TRINITY_DN33892_c0_g1_i2.p1  ORF type:complete len:276 (-),score=49.51 TRINITY_DN33892_c0_g1_i2:139-966(-)